ncbi:MAG: ferredoxin [Polyangiaceae bacterium]|nr:ferredoxin [Polyangiaceae bacterium]
MPDAEAPELFGTADDSCYVRRQPENRREVDRMLRAVIASEVECIRYGGTDPAIIRRLAECGVGALSDVAPPSSVRRRDRDHVGLRLAHLEIDADGLVDKFIAYLVSGPLGERYRTQTAARGADYSHVRVAWFEDRFHSVSVRRLVGSRFDWLILGLTFSVYDWLEREQLGEAVFFDASDWAGAQSHGSATPW